jgi:hypothetical protein
LEEKFLLTAQRVRLIVLAPASYYHEVSPPLLRAVRHALNVGLTVECSRENPAGLVMEFDFEQLGDSFEPDSGDDRLIDAVLRRHPVLAGH